MPSRITVSTIANSARPTAATMRGMLNIVVKTRHVPEATASPAFSAAVVTGSGLLYLEFTRAEPMAATMSASTDRTPPVIEGLVDGFLTGFAVVWGFCVFGCIPTAWQTVSDKSTVHVHKSAYRDITAVEGY